MKGQSRLLGTAQQNYEYKFNHGIWKALSDCQRFSSGHAGHNLVLTGRQQMRKVGQKTWTSNRDALSRFSQRLDENTKCVPLPLSARKIREHFAHCGQPFLFQNNNFKNNKPRLRYGSRHLWCYRRSGERIQQIIKQPSVSRKTKKPNWITLPACPKLILTFWSWKPSYPNSRDYEPTRARLASLLENQFEGNRSIIRYWPSFERRRMLGSLDRNDY